MEKRSFISGVGVGAVAMYLLDPGTGRRRRALIRDQVKHVLRRSEAAVGKTRRDLKNRAQGVGAMAGSLFRRDEAGDAVLEARVRSQLGRLISHPGAISVEVRPGGAVVLSGPVLERELPELMAAVGAIPGVSSVESRLQPHPHTAGIPGLQGGKERHPQHRVELMQTNWSPAARALVGAAGSTLAFWGLARRGVSGATVGILGAAALLRSISNKDMKQIAGGVRRNLEVRSIVNIDCPVERVYEFWANYENFPLFMSHLKQVQDLGRGKSHWIAVGPAGIAVEWDAEITELRPNELLAWRSVKGSTVENAGTVRFTATGEGSSRLDVQMSYNPPAGAMGHVVARIFGADPEHAITEDLLRLKSLLEKGKTTAKGKTITRDKLEGVARSLVPGEMSS